MQMEGCLTMGLGYALSEEIRFDGGRHPHDRNFDTYEIPRFSGMPAHRDGPREERRPDAQGGGEPAIVPVGAGVANAILDATGARLFEMPMTPERVKEALAAVRRPGTPP